MGVNPASTARRPARSRVPGVHPRPPRRRHHDRPSPPHRLARLLAAGVAAATLAAPPAVARPIDGAQEPRRPGPTEAPVVVRHIDAGFDWGSAAVGAGAAGALIVLVSLGGFAYTARHRVGLAR
jgi:hypothetical protein